MILHTVSQSPFASSSLKDCLKLMAEEDILLLMNDAVVACHTTLESQIGLVQLSENNRLFVLNSDLEARGVTAHSGEVIDYAKFVSLAVQCKSQLKW